MSSLTESTGEDPNSKLKVEERQKSSRKTAQPKIKDDQSAKSASSKSEDKPKEQPKSKKMSNKKREKICLAHIKELKELESRWKGDSGKNYLDEDAPEFCSNKSCPISDSKIIKSAKILTGMKKVALRKAQFQDQDDRWYCLRCLKAHNNSLFCFYCGQIYFEDENDFEDDGKAWIQ